MFCPQCEAEYQPHVHRCSDCDVPLVEHLPVTTSHRKQRSGFVVFKENGIVLLLILWLATIFIWIALKDNPFGIQIAAVTYYTGFVFLLVFCDAGGGIGSRKGTKGYSLGEKAVREKLPLLLRIHIGFLAVIFAGATGALWARRHMLFLWLWNLDTPYFALILVFAGVAIQFVQIHIFRGILGRALKNEQSSGDY
jgi:peptidoglycan/LPS O-acetylase OafA/YrhL